MRTRRSIASATFTAAALLALGAAPALAASTTTVNANLKPVVGNGVNGSGTAMVDVEGTKITVTLAATGLVADMPHAAHIHFGADARHECPAVADDANGDGHLSTSEGGAAYGAVVVSLTKTGDTSPDSALAIDRFDTAPAGKLTYQRGSITVSQEVATAIGKGQSVVVIHGVDYNENGKFDGSAKSDLDPALPAEATDPALCGVLMAAPTGGMATGLGGTQGGVNTGLLALGGGALVAAAGTGVLAARRTRTQD